MRFLLDTHILLWWYLDQPEIPSKFLPLLEEAKRRGEGVGLSIISLWEIAKLVSLGKLEMTVSLDLWFEELENDPVLKILPLNARIILESTKLGLDFPKDPADQLIVATARCQGLRLMTADERILRSGGVALV